MEWMDARDWSEKREQDMYKYGMDGKCCTDKMLDER